MKFLIFFLAATLTAASAQALPWQVTPTIFSELTSGPDKAASSRVMNAMFTMKKFDIEKLKQAYRG
jgi:hypothetical protein